MTQCRKPAHHLQPTPPLCRAASPLLTTEVRSHPTHVRSLPRGARGRRPRSRRTCRAARTHAMKRMAGAAYPAPEYASRVVGGEEVRAIRAAQVAELAALLHVPHARAESLLREASWNIEDAAVRAMDGDASAPALVSAPASASGSAPASASTMADLAAPVSTVSWTRVPCKEDAACATCFDDDTEDAHCTDCGAVLCDDCWTRYFRAMLTSGSNVVICPMPKCSAVVPGVMVKAVLAPDVELTMPQPSPVTEAGRGTTEPSTPTPFAPTTAGSGKGTGEQSNSQLLDRYLACQMKDFVAGSSDLRECPGRECNGIVNRTNVDESDVVCDACKAAFCWKCGLESHSPLDCQNAKEWVVQSSTDVRCLRHRFLHQVLPLFWADVFLTKRRVFKNSSFPLSLCFHCSCTEQIKMVDFTKHQGVPALPD